MQFYLVLNLSLSNTEMRDPALTMPLFLRLLSAVHATLATAAGVTVVMSCADVMTDKYERSQYRSLSDLVPTKDVSILCV